ncbi:hypothetical protein D1007_29801 [Hordeum vulgare]|nr:hypothetical protein D1007_29801 [Hordeum vulgare]
MVGLPSTEEKEDNDRSNSSADKHIRLDPYYIVDSYFHEKDGNGTEKVSTNNGSSWSSTLGYSPRSTPNASKARAMLLNGRVRKGERLVPAETLDLFMRCTFPVPNARVKATKRFEAAYPIIKELALVGTPGYKAVKQASQQLLPLAVKAMQEREGVAVVLRAREQAAY